MGLCLFLAIARPESFLSVENLSYMIRAFSFTAIMAFGECMVMITGGIDLSIGSVFGLSSVCAALMMKFLLGTGSFPPDSIMLTVICLLTGIVVGVFVGCVNAVFITQTRLPPFIATLGMLSIARGLTDAISMGWPIAVSSPVFRFLGQGFIGWIPAPVLLMILFAFASSFFLQKTIIGRYVFAIGNNEESAKLSGIPVNGVKCLAYALSGMFAGIGGMLLVARLGVAHPSIGIGYELDGVAAVVIGGVSLMGGEGSILGVVLGAAVMGVIRNGLVLLNVSAYWHTIAIGTVLICAMALDQFRKGQFGRKTRT